MQISVHLFNQTDFENFENKKILENLGFEAKYRQTCFLPESYTLFVGLELKKVKTFDPFYKVDFFHLGAKIAESLAKMKVHEIQIDYISDFPTASGNFESEKAKKLSKNLLDLQLGINQKLWKFDKYKTNLQKENSGNNSQNESENLENSALKTYENSKIKIRLCPNLAKQFSEFDALKLTSLNSGMSLNRFVVEETPEFFNPKTAVEIVQKELGNYENVEIKVRDYDWLLNNDFGGVCAVGRASENKPNLVHTKLNLGRNLESQKNKLTDWKVFILPCRGGETSHNFYQSVKYNLADLVAKVEILQVPSSTSLDSQNWLETLNRIKDKLDEKTIFITHSLGSLALSRFLTENEIKLGAWHSVAGVFGFGQTSERSYLEQHFATFDPLSLDWIKIGKSISQVFIHHARLDPTVNFQAAQNYCQKIPKAELVVENDKYGHFGGQPSFDFPELVSKILHNLPKNTTRNTDKVLIFGTPNYELKTPRENVRGVLFDPKLQKYCLVQMENLPFFLVGGKIENEDLKTALAREIREELGYTDFEIKTKLGKEILSYCPREKVDKIEKTFCSETGFLVVLNSQNEQALELSEMEKIKKLTKVWLNSNEIQQIWQDDKLNNPQLEPFWEIFQRGVSKAIQLGLDKVSNPEIFDKEFVTRIVLIGKGLTYDTGGLDIKTDGHMKEMKCDMGGSGLMLGVMKTLAEMSNKTLENRGKTLAKNPEKNPTTISKSKNLEIQNILENLNFGTSENMIFGKKVGDELENPRINVRAVIFDPKSNKFCFVKMGDLPILAGGGTDGENLETALRREIQEELGYTDFEIQTKLGEPIISCMPNDKPTHRYCSDSGFLVILNSLDKIGTNLSEEEKQDNLREVWLSSLEILDILQTNLKSDSPDSGYARHLEIFRRGLEKIEKNELETVENQSSNCETKNCFIKQDWDISTLQIETERLTLKPISLDFAEDIFREFTSEITEYMYPKPNENLEETQKFIQKAMQTDIEKSELHLVIQNKNGEFLGMIGLHELNTENPEFGIWLKKSAHGNKFGQEAALVFKIWTDKHLNYQNLIYPVDHRNIGSKKVAEFFGGISDQKITNKMSGNGKTLEIVEYQITNPNYQDFGLPNQTENAENLNSEFKALENILNGETLEIHWLTAFCENSVNSDSYRSDDILTSFSGQTVEVWNTDAEGRLTLADVLSYATLLEPDFIVDAATLTGACVVANSCHFTGLMGNDENLNENLLASFVANCEPTVQNHFPEILRESVTGDLGDLVNTGKLQRQAGHITAGLFLSHFIDQNNWRPQILEKHQIKNPKTYAWTHLDIAGTAFNKKQNALEANGATGQSVRSLVDWIFSLIF